MLFGIPAAILGLSTALRGYRRLGWGAFAAGVIGIALGILATHSTRASSNLVFTASLIASMFVFSTPLVFGAIGGMFSERSGVVNIGLEGMMLMGAFWGVYGADKGGSWAVGILVAMLAGGLLALVHAFFAIHLRADQIVGGTAVNFLALGITGYFFFQLYHGQDVPVGVSTIPDVKLPASSHVKFLSAAFGDLNLMVWLSFVLVIVSWRRPLQDGDRPSHPRLRRAPARGGHGGHQRLRHPLRERRRLGRARRARRRLPLDRLRRRRVHRQHDRGPRLHRARGA